MPLLLVLMAFLAAAPARAQGSRWVVDPKLSLAWWQINPHLNHLWATTCPADPSWRPGEDRGSGWRVPTLKLSTGYSTTADTVVPLFPRKWALPLCAPALRGEVVTDDAKAWTGTRGQIVLKADALVSGLDMRDRYARQAILETARFPEIRFQVDSLVEVQPGDTLRALIKGVFEFRGVRREVTAPAVAWREAGGLRITADFDHPARDLVDVYGISRLALGLGVGGLVWKTIHLGIDIVMKPATED